MTQVVRFPYPAPTRGMASEATQIIEIFSGGVILQGGPATYVSTLPWRRIDARTASPYTEFVVEFTADQPVEFGDGTFPQQVGIYGVIGNLSSGEKFLLGVLGMSRGGVAPQISLLSAPDVGYAQPVCNLALYDGIAIGGVENNITPEEATVICRVRPVRRRGYLG